MVKEAIVAQRRRGGVDRSRVAIPHVFSAANTGGSLPQPFVTATLLRRPQTVRERAV